MWVMHTTVTESRKNNLVTLIFARVSGKSSHENICCYQRVSLHDLCYLLARKVISFLVREHLQILIGNLVSNLNTGMFGFQYLLHATKQFPFESRFNRKSIGSISIHIGTRASEQRLLGRTFQHAVFTQ